MLRGVMTGVKGLSQGRMVRQSPLYRGFSLPERRQLEDKIPKIK